MRKSYIIKAVLFALIFVLLFCAVSKIVTYPSDYRNYQWIGGFYKEEKESLDAVYIGSSNCYAFWNSMTAWEEYGITVYPYSCNAMSFIATEYLIKEARKTQPDALFVVNINTISEQTVTIEKVHHLLDYMPFSFNKLQLIDALADAGEFTTEERMECIVPMLRYHGRWNDLNKQDFGYRVNGMKGASYYSTFLHSSADITDRYVTTEETLDVSDVYEEALDSLLDYCDEENVEVLFVTVPRAEKDVERLSQINKMNEIIKERGYDTLYLMDKAEEIGLDITTDYYNRNHTNIHGSIKYTQYLSEYLIENYGFEDKRGNEDYSSWDKGYEKYAAKIDSAVLDVELDAEHRDYDIAEPKDLKAVLEDGKVTVSWDEVKEADGYVVCRRAGKKAAWEQIDAVNGIKYEDNTYEEEIIYTYRVVPFYEENGEKYYGNFSYLGVSIGLEEGI